MIRIIIPYNTKGLESDSKIFLETIKKITTIPDAKNHKKTQISYVFFIIFMFTLLNKHL